MGHSTAVFLITVNQLFDLLAVLLDWGDSGSSVAFGMLEGTSIVLLDTITGLEALMLSFIIVPGLVALAGGATSAGSGMTRPLCCAHAFPKVKDTPTSVADNTITNFGYCFINNAVSILSLLKLEETLI
jgi:hypothetical protein